MYHKVTNILYDISFNHQNKSFRQNYYSLKKTEAEGNE